MKKQQIAKRYPRLITVLCEQWVLNTDEAVCCIRDYLAGHTVSCEAISWNGRTPKEAIQKALKARLPYWLRDKYVSKAKLDEYRTTGIGTAALVTWRLHGWTDEKIHVSWQPHKGIRDKVRPAPRTVSIPVSMPIDGSDSLDYMIPNSDYVVVGKMLVNC